MIHGMNTGFLVAAEVVEHPDHVAARATLSRLLIAKVLGPATILAEQGLGQATRFVCCTHYWHNCPLLCHGSQVS